MSNAPQPAGATRVIKRYSNRKLYDTCDSRYVTLQQIGEMVRRGEDVQIIDNKTKEDKTEATLALILSEDLKSKPRSVPLAALRTLIQERSDKFMSHLREGPLRRLIPDSDEEAAAQAAAEGSQPPASSASAAPEQAAAATVTAAEATAAEATAAEATAAEATAAEATAATAAEATAAPGQDKRPNPAVVRINEFVESSRHTLEQLQARVDESMRSMPGMAQLHEVRASIKALEQRIEAIERILKVGAVDAAVSDASVGDETAAP